MSTRAALYLRISRDFTGEQLAVTRQREACQRIARERGWAVVGEYVDNSVSASDRRKDRPAYDQLCAAYDAGDYEALIVWDLDRLTRQPRELEDWVDRAEQRQLCLVTANGEADLSTDGGRMYARIKIAVARAEVDRKAARQVAAAAQRAELGRPPLGVRLTGYTPRGELVAPEAAAVRQVFARFAAGDSLRSLAAWLDESMPTRHGRPWNPSSVRTILTNPRYAGRAVYRGKPTGQRGAWEPLVDDATFNAVQATLADPRRRTQTGTHRKWLGSGLYYCGTCKGERLTGWSQARYCCRLCGLTRSRTQVDAFVRAVIRERLSRPDLRGLLPVEQDEASRQRQAEVIDLRARLAQTERDYDEDLIDARRYAVKAEKLRAALGTAESALSRASGSRAGLTVLTDRDPVAAFDGAPLMIQRGVLDALCDVSLMPGTRYSRTFDPATVSIDWKAP